MIVEEKYIIACPPLRWFIHTEWLMFTREVQLIKKGNDLYRLFTLNFSAN